MLAAAELCDQPDDAADEEATAYKELMLNTYRNPTCTDAVRAVRCHQGGGSCVQSLKAGFLFEETAFTRDVCLNGPDSLDALGITYATELVGNESVPLRRTINARAPCATCPGYLEYMDELKAAVVELQAAGVTYLISCTYHGSAKALMTALHDLEYAPLAVMSTGAISTPLWSIEHAGTNGWWLEYVLEPVDWHRADNGTVGAFSNWTSTDFHSAYTRRYPGAHVGYTGASAFASVVALAHAIELAGTVQTARVLDALGRMDLTEFYGRLRFNPSVGMREAEQVVTQFLADGDEEDLVYTSNAAWNASWDPSERGDDGAVRLSFPAPTWTFRECMYLSNACSGNGMCSAEGQCLCASGWQGSSCSQAWSSDKGSGTETLLVVICSVAVGALFAGVCVLRRVTSPGHSLLLDATTGNPPALALEPHHRYLLFMSHVWSTGQDQASVITRRLQYMLPGADVFLEYVRAHQTPWRRAWAGSAHCRGTSLRLLTSRVRSLVSAALRTSSTLERWRNT